LHIREASHSPALDRAARACVLAGLVVFAAFVVWLERMPAGFDSIRGLNPLAAAEWRARFGAGDASIPEPLYRAGVQVLQVVSWVLYGLLLALVYRGARFSAAWTWRLAVPVLLAVAVAMPAALSADAFAYVGYARLAVVHGLNPHLHTQAELVKLGDPTGPYLHWPIASPYGPLWTLVCMAIVAAGRLFSTDGIWGVVLALKLLGAAGVLGMAALLRALVRRGDDPERAEAAFVLMLVNPVSLCEGPGNGHNDVVMMALALAGLVAWLTPMSGRASGQSSGRAHPLLAAVWLGVAAAVKLIPLLLLPWVALSALRSGNGARRWGRATAIVCLGFAPVVLAYAPFWSGGRALGGLAERFRSADQPDQTDLAPGPPRADPDASGTATSPTTDGPPPRQAIRRSGGPLVHLVRRTWLTALVYAGATLILWRGGAPLLALTGWAYLSSAVMLFVAGLWFPWYLTWTWPAVLARANRHHQVLTLVLFLFSLLLMMVYATPP